MVRHGTRNRGVAESATADQELLLGDVVDSVQVPADAGEPIAPGQVEARQDGVAGDVDIELEPVEVEPRLDDLRTVLEGGGDGLMQVGAQANAGRRPAAEIRR